MESVKCTVLGTPRCGKTSLIHRYVYGEWLQDERHTTAELYSLPISHVCVVGIWDTGTWRGGRIRINFLQNNALIIVNLI